MRAKAKFWELTGYRLPTEAEWEFACRAGAGTSRYYGVTDTLLTNYACYLVNAADHTWPVASLNPNDCGLFGMHGNAHEWVYDPLGDYPSGSRDAVDAPNADAVFSSMPVLLAAALNRSPRDNNRRSFRTCPSVTIATSM